MNSHFEKGAPVVRGNAGVIHWNLELVFLSKEQRNLLVNWLSAHELDYNFEVETVLGDSITPDKYLVYIIDMCWGSNLVEFGEFLETIDYNAGG